MLKKGLKRVVDVPTSLLMCNSTTIRRILLSIKFTRYLNSNTRLTPTVSNTMADFEAMVIYVLAVGVNICGCCHHIKVM